ncbi:ClpXP protease specificity-enhancing factor [Gilvimarinus sp. F26214L]|uniref:ClpXP protease specificity-enhancing factor n=1 Tax=Gilvimarinus sp. DZF01 TaxID=3461371 RepID=UPI0040455956
MSSSRPYLIRALYQWIVDNDSTPYLLVDGHGEGVSVPQTFVNKDGQIVLNVSPTAVKDLQLGNEVITFNARFGGVPTDIFVPCGSVLGIYARENGQGMIFEPEPDREPPPPSGGDETGPKGRPSLRVVK